MFFCADFNPRFPAASVGFRISDRATISTLRSVRLEETFHYQITRGILEDPESYWRHLVKDQDPD